MFRLKIVLFGLILALCGTCFAQPIGPFGIDWTAANQGTIDATNIEDKFLRNDTSDTMSGILTADGFVLGAGEKIQFRDSDIYISSGVDGYLALTADIGVDIGADILLGETNIINLNSITHNDIFFNAIRDACQLEHTLFLGTPQAGIGVGLGFKIEDLGGSEEQGSIDVLLTTVTGGSEDADMVFSLNVGGSITEMMRLDSSAGKLDLLSYDLETSGSFITTGNGETGKFLTGSAGNTVFAFSGDNFDIRAGSGGASAQNVMRVTQAGDFDFKAGNLITTGTLGAGAITGTSLAILTTGEINFRDTDISIGSTLTDGILDISADVSVDFFYDNAAVGDGVDGQSLHINRRTVQGSDYISLYVDKDRKGLIGFSGDDDLLQLAANALTVNGTVTGTNLEIAHWDTAYGWGDHASGGYQAQGDVLDDFNTLGAPASDGQFIVATGAGAFTYESTTTARASLGIGEADSPTFAGLTLTGGLTVDTNTLVVDIVNHRVGINTATPEFPLDLYQNTDTKGILLHGFDDKVTSWVKISVNHLGNFRIEGSDNMYFTSPGYTWFISGGAEPMFFDCGSTFYFRDVDAANAIRVTIASATGVINTVGHYAVDGTQVVTNQQAHIADAPGDTTANNATTINLILTALETHGLLAGS